MNARHNGISRAPKTKRLLHWVYVSDKVTIEALRELLAASEYYETTYGHANVEPDEIDEDPIE
jgi:hypothetical protein